MRYYLGIDGGGTRTTVALADEAGAELCRRTGPAGIVDPRRPLAAADAVAALAREVLSECGLGGPVEGLCAGLAGTGDPTGRELVRAALQGRELARRVEVCSDGEIALEGAFPEGAGVLLVAGTGSVAFGRNADGRVERCGGWGTVAGDEGSAYWLGREALRAALRAYDGRGPQTQLLTRVLRATGAPDAGRLPTWAGRVAKSEIARLAREVVALAGDGDGVAAALVEEAAAGLAEHVMPLVRRLELAGETVTVVLHGGLAEQPLFARALQRSLDQLDVGISIGAPQADAVTGALRRARRG